MEPPKKKKIKSSTEKIPSADSGNSDDSSDASVTSPKQDRLKNIMLNVRDQRHRLKDLKKDQRVASEKLQKLQQDIHGWMEAAGMEKIVWNNTSINPYSTAAAGRTHPGDILEVVGELYGQEALEKVVDELDRLHAARYDGMYDVRFLRTVEAESEPQRSTKKDKSHSDRPKSTRKKVKQSLIL